MVVFRWFQRRAWVLTGVVLLGLLTALILRDIHRARTEIDLILDEGIVGLDRAEQVLQTLLDLRAGVLSTLLPSTEADRRAAAAELSQRLEVLDRQNDRLAELEFEDLLHEDESDQLKRLIDITEESVAQVIAQCIEPSGDIVVSVRSATSVSTQIDACATELHVLSTRVAARARVSDSEIPDSLTRAEGLTVAMAALAFVIGLVTVRRTRSQGGGTLTAGSRGLALEEPATRTSSSRRARTDRAFAGEVVPERAGADRLRIVHVLTHVDATRGGAIQALLLAREQLKAGHQVQIVANCRRRGNPMHPTFGRWAALGLQFRFYEMSDTQGAWCSPLEIIRFREYLARQRFDVVHVHRDKALLFALVATSGLAVPAFVSQRGTTHAFRHRVVALAHRSRRVHRIIAVAEAVKTALVGQRVPAAKIDVVYGSFDVDRFDPARVDRTRVRGELEVSDPTMLVVVIGELNPRKDPATFIKAFGLVLERRSDVLFVHAGDATEKRLPKYHAMGRQYCGDRLRFLGWRKDVPEILAAADIVVNASSADEGLTGAVREALAMARPVICTATDGNPEIVLHGRTGILVPPRDPAALAAAVESLLDAPELRARLGAAGRELVLSRMTSTMRAQRVEQIYRQLIAERTQSPAG